MKKLALIAVVIAGCASSTDSEPFRVKSSKYIPGGFGSSEKTVVESKSGARHVFRGHIDVPAPGTGVVIRSGLKRDGSQFKSLVVVGDGEASQ